MAHQHDDGGHHGGGTRGASDGNRSTTTPPQPATATTKILPWLLRETIDYKSVWTPVPFGRANADVVGKGKEVVVVVPSVKQQHGGTVAEGDRTDAAVAAAQGKISSGVDDVMASGVVDDVTKGKGKAVVAAPPTNGGGNQVLLPGCIDQSRLLERQRRQRVKEKYEGLRALIPGVDKQTDKATMINEAINYIRVLEDIVQNLERRKQELALAREAAAAIAAEAAASSSSSVTPPGGGAAQQQGAAVALAPYPLLPQGWWWLPKQRPQQQPAAAAPVRFGFQTWTGANVVLNVSGDDAYIAVCAARRPGVLVMVVSVLHKHHIDVVTAQIASDQGRTLFSVYTRVNMEEIWQLDPEPPAAADVFKLAVSEIIVWLSS